MLHRPHGVLDRPQLYFFGRKQHKECTRQDPPPEGTRHTERTSGSHSCDPSKLCALVVAPYARYGTFPSWHHMLATDVFSGQRYNPIGKQITHDIYLLGHARTL